VRLARIRFTEMLIDANSIDPAEFTNWAFTPGMGYGAMDKWWGDFGTRDFPHEGIDICLYETRSGEMRRLDGETRIPVMEDGIVRAMFKDYLGQAIIVEHENSATNAGPYLSVYAHTRPRDGLRPGAAVRGGEILATIADTCDSKARILPHLHLSLGRPSPDLVYEDFIWNIMRDPERVTLMDPMAVLNGIWREIDLSTMDCLGR
jgi:murein DD-endopeptidase MepM/ murein hydrolase activator NlpD